MKKLFLLSLCIFCTSLFTQGKLFAQDTLFSFGKEVKTIEDSNWSEISGLAFSHRYPNRIYLHNDSGGEAAVYLMDSLGNASGKVFLNNATNRDWEDIAVGPGPKEKSYVYVAEIGDNFARYDAVKIYRFTEPENLDSSVEVEVATLTYPGGAKDAESLFVDPISGEIYIVSKRDESNTLYRVPANAFDSKESQLEELIKFPFTYSVAADISADGAMILIKSYTTIFFWGRNPGETISETLSRAPIQLPYSPEPQGEAIAFSPDGKAFYTLSETRFDILPVLYRYQKLD